MDVHRDAIRDPRVPKLVAAVIAGLGLGTMIPPEPVALPGIGSVPGLVAGPVALGIGIGLYVAVPRLLGESGCGCSGECNCQ